MKNPVNAFLFMIMTIATVFAAGLSWALIYLRG